MPLHDLRSITVGVPDAAPVIEYYEEFGLGAAENGVMDTVDVPAQLRVHETRSRQLTEIMLAVDDDSDLLQIGDRLTSAGFEHQRTDEGLIALDAPTKVRVCAQVLPRIVSAPAALAPTNAIGRMDRPDGRAPWLDRPEKVRVRRLGHVVMASPDAASTTRLLVQGFGFVVSDSVGGIMHFLRCTEAHHNILVMPSKAAFLHHSAWEVEDVDDVGRAAVSMLQRDPERQVWGLGRHHLGSNYFWYLRDPAGNFAEYFTDMDCILDQDKWLAGDFAPRDVQDWPPPPLEFIRPPDLQTLIDAQR